MSAGPAGQESASATWSSLRELQRLQTSDLESLTGLRLLAPKRRQRCDDGQRPLPSHAATWRDLATASTDHHGVVLPLTSGWPDRWYVTYRDRDGDHTQSVRTVDPRQLLTADPVRNSTWRANTRARAGLHYVTSTGRLHWHESLFERDLLIALDFGGDLVELSSQPFTLHWHDGSRWIKHTPDFATVLDGQLRLFNTRPAAMMDQSTLSNAAALRAVCGVRGWVESLVVDYVRPALTVVRTLTAACRTVDPYSASDRMLDMLERRGPSPFGDLVAATAHPALSRAVLQQLIWTRDVTVDLAQPLTDESGVALTPLGAQA